MTISEIEEKRMQENVKHEAAKEIRRILDEAREAFGADAWDENDVQSAVLELVTED